MLKEKALENKHLFQRSILDFLRKRKELCGGKEGVENSRRPIDGFFAKVVKSA